MKFYPIAKQGERRTPPVGHSFDKASPRTPLSAMTARPSLGPTEGDYEGKGASEKIDTRERQMQTDLEKEATAALAARAASIFARQQEHQDDLKYLARIVAELAVRLQRLGG